LMNGNWNKNGSIITETGKGLMWFRDKMGLKGKMFEL